MFQRFIVLLHNPLARIVPVLLKATEVTPLSCYKVAISVFVSRLQNLIIPSPDPLARIVPILLKATAVTPNSCADKLAISFFVSMHQSFIILFYDPLARIVPILLKATEFIIIYVLEDYKDMKVKLLLLLLTI